jgi:transcriptional regulator with XRE-family HTH domain
MTSPARNLVQRVFSDDGQSRKLKGKGWTQTDLAVHLDMNRGHISDIEQGKREVGIITLPVIARGLDTTMAKLLKGV